MGTRRPRGSDGDRLDDEPERGAGRTDRGHHGELALGHREPRDGGNFYWMQSYGALKCGAESIYLAMLDEVDESTAFFKVAENKSMSPVEGYWLNLDADGQALPSDWYLRAAGNVGRGRYESRRP